MGDNKASSAIQEGTFKHSIREHWTDVGYTGLTVLPKLEIQVLGSGQSVWRTHLALFGKCWSPTLSPQWSCVHSVNKAVLGGGKSNPTKLF